MRHWHFENWTLDFRPAPSRAPVVFRSERGLTGTILLYLLGTPGVVHRYLLGVHRTRCCCGRGADPVARNNALWSSWSNSDEFPRELSSAETGRATFRSTAVLNNVAGRYAEDYGSVSHLAGFRRWLSFPCCGVRNRREILKTNHHEPQIWT